VCLDREAVSHAAGEAAKALMKNSSRTSVADRRAAEPKDSEPRRAVREAPDVLLVDDDTELAGMIAFGLESAGYSVETYDSGPEALIALLALPTRGLPRLLLLSVDLPGMDGHTLHEQLQTARPGRFIVAFLSDRDSNTDQVRALTAGAVDYLAKPVSIPVLIVKVDAWLSRE
jgi:DNA-binding response OmpR family regulator